MARFEGKVAFITGAARGQGRSHAIRFAEEGADIIAVDICSQIPTVDYPLATPEDLAETVALVEKLDRRIVAREADVRDFDALEAAVREGVAELGRLDFVIANAGLGVTGAERADRASVFRDVVDVNLTGVWNTLQAAIPILIEQGQGGAAVLTSSTYGLRSLNSRATSVQAYAASKHGMVGIMRNFAITYAGDRIRVNTIHPTGVATPMIQNEVMERLVTDSPEIFGAMSNPMPVDVIEPRDVSDAVLFLCSDEARYITGVALPVDAGLAVK